MQVVPAPLFRFTLQVMGSVFRIGPLRKPVCTFAFDRRTEVSERLLAVRLRRPNRRPAGAVPLSDCPRFARWCGQAAHVAIEERAVMVSTPASVKAFQLKLIEILHLLDTGMYPRMHSAIGKIAYARDGSCPCVGSHARSLWPPLAALCVHMPPSPCQLCVQS
jgi:hypothetical protein